MSVTPPVNTCMDCGVIVEDWCPTGWSRDPNGDCRCDICTPKATHRSDECGNCGHDRWEHTDCGCCHCNFVGDYGEYNEYCMCERSGLNPSFKARKETG